jgi:prepilin-type N-terminal cleavage/methylation domain-containing protein
MRLKSRSGFTLTEVMIVIAILSVMAGLAVPGYFRAIEQGRANEARTNLNIILMGQKIYRLNNASFWNGGSNATPANIQTNLNVDLTTRHYTDIDFSSVDATGYTVRITRNNVDGGAGTKWFQHAWNDTTDVLTETEGGSY